MTFIASLKNGSYTAQMARARSLSMVSLAGLDFTWNGRQYQTGILTDISQEVQETPQIVVASMGITPDPVLLGLEAQEAVIETKIKAEQAKAAKPVAKKAT